MVDVIIKQDYRLCSEVQIVPISKVPLVVMSPRATYNDWSHQSRVWKLFLFKACLLKPSYSRVVWMQEILVVSKFNMSHWSFLHAHTINIEHKKGACGTCHLISKLQICCLYEMISDWVISLQQIKSSGQLCGWTLNIINQIAGVCSATFTFLYQVMCDQGVLDQRQRSSVAKPERDTPADSLMLDLLHS